ncbi:MAG: arginine--tRNA ligase [Ezakiella massiliensis]
MIDKLKDKINLSTEELEKIIVVPQDRTMGDLALPCFALAKTMRKAPQAIAEEIKSSIDFEPDFEKVQAVGPYLNFFISKDKLKDSLVESFKADGEEYGKSDFGQGRHVVIDYSSPNIAKPFHIGHIRSTLIGNAIYRIAKRIGFDPVGVNHLGDYGTLGMLIAYKEWATRMKLKNLLTNS